MTVIRTLAALLASLHAANAAAMIFIGRAWYEATPGVPGTGPYNPHFVVDIGLAFAVSSAGLAIWAARPSVGAGIIWMACAWPALHAGFHLTHWPHHLPTGAALVTEAVGVVGLAALGLFIAQRATGRSRC